TEAKEDKRADAFLKQVSRLKRLAGEREKLVAESGRAKTSKLRRDRIAKRLELIRQAVKECLLETQLGAKHITLLVDKLKEAHRGPAPRDPPARAALRPPRGRHPQARRPHPRRREGCRPDGEPTLPGARRPGGRGGGDDSRGASQGTARAARGQHAERGPPRR